jgi:type III pantothenate kinase
VLAEIDGMINFYKEQYNDLIVVLTGGNASLFANKIKNKIFADSELLLKGLNIILRHNVR